VPQDNALLLFGCNYRRITAFSSSIQVRHRVFVTLLCIVEIHVSIVVPKRL
jgi:hypothetical protein